jgi:hypothetical protein
MDWMSRSDLILLAVAAYVAVMALVRLMKRRHDQVVADVQRQVNARSRGHRPPEREHENRDAA